MTLFCTGQWISAMETGRKPVLPESYARVARALGMTAQEWENAANAGRYGDKQQQRLHEIAREIDKRADSPVSPVLSVEQVKAQMAALRSHCGEEAFLEALRQTGYLPHPPPPPARIAA